VIIEDVLYGAQVRRSRETGHMTSVSEIAIDHEPWFIYQGYQIAPEGGTWRVDAAAADARFARDEFAASNRAVSTKGAFLWLAARPGEYSANLYRLVREACRTDDLGFTTGVYERSSAASRLSDVNTNGVVLETIEHILGGRQPLLRAQ
jgi:hypothetical protein